jgi:cell division GTPase FtsZ
LFPRGKRVGTLRQDRERVQKTIVAVVIVVIIIVGMGGGTTTGIVVALLFSGSLYVIFRAT